VGLHFVAWEIIYFKFLPDFVDKYASYMIEKLRTSGASQQVIDAKLQQMKSFKAMYDNPFINAGITFFEPFPIGLITVNGHQSLRLTCLLNMAFLTYQA